jgi:phage recombination protein Bet
VTDLEVVRPDEVAERYPKPPPLSIAAIEQVRQFLAPDLDDDELALFVAITNRAGLDPFGRQIWAYKRSGKLVIQASIDGLRLVALRTGLYGGQLAAKWCGPDRQWFDVWLDKDNPPAAAMKAVIRKDYPTPTTAVAVFDSYAARGKDGNLLAVWATAPDVMLAKCAEALAIRQAFPNETAGLYVPGEIPTDEPTPVIAAPADPTGGDLPATQEDIGPLKNAIEQLTPKAKDWLLGVAKADRIPNIDGPKFRRWHRDRLAWHILVACRIKGERTPTDEPTPPEVHDDAPETTPNNIDEGD